MNYQESLNFIKESFFFADDKEQEALDNLQQLIALEENQRAIIEDVNKYKKSNEKLSFNNRCLETQNENQFRKIQELEEKLKFGDRKKEHDVNCVKKEYDELLSKTYSDYEIGKAFDLACQYLSEIKGHCGWNQLNGNCPFTGVCVDCKYYVSTESDWKKHILSEVLSNERL